MALGQFVDRTVARLLETPVDLALLPAEGVAGALFSGATGVAFFLHEAARLLGEERLLDRGRLWLDAARGWAESATRDDWKELAHGFLIGESGLAYVEALYAAREGDAAKVLRAAERIERASGRFDDLRGGFWPTELVGGGAGVVCATRSLDERLPRGDEYEASRALLRRIRDRSMAALIEARATPIDPATPDTQGLAHGFAGQLWALVAVLGADHDLVRAGLSQLEALREIDEEGLVYWLPTKATEDTIMLGTWCNGIAGHSLLWTEVARQRRSEDALHFAGQVAESTEVLLSANPSLCCGLAGQSVALQRYADLSGDARFAKRAYRRLTRAIRVLGPDYSGYQLGLWQGTLGVALVAMSRLHGERSFPCIEPLGA